MFKHRPVPLALAVVTTVVLQLGAPAVAWADEETPPPEPVPLVEETTDGPAIAETSLADAPQEEPAPIAADILAQVPEGSSVLVLDPAGEPQPLVTLEAAEAIVTSDPVWCPAGITNPLDSACTGSQPSFSALLTFLDNNPSYAGAGTIFFYSAVPMVYSLDDIHLSPTTPGAGNLTTLTLDGMGHQFVVPIEVTSWAYGVSVVDVNMDLTTYGTPAAGLRVETAGAILVDDVSVTGSGGGAYLDNVGGTGGITVADSQFIGNSSTGLDARTSGDILVHGVTATGNEYGAYLDASAGTGSVAVDTSDFSNSALGGLTARSAAGDIGLTFVTADGATDPTGYGAGLTTSGGAIQVDGGSFQGNGGKGLWIEASAAVDLNSVTASANGLHGAYIHNLGACAATPIAVTVDGGTYQTNGGYGILAVLGPGGGLTFGTTPTWGGNGSGDYLEDLSPCPVCEEKPDGKPFNVVHVPETGGPPVPLNCTDFAGTVLILPDGTRTTLVCPVSEEATLEIVTESGLPAPLPTSRSFVAGIDLTVMQGGVPLSVIGDDGYIRLAFAIPEGLRDASLAIFYWDPTLNGGQGGWVELPPYALLPDGSPMPHRLHPDVTPDDGMRILGGVRVVGDFVKVAVNFPGIFVLAER